MSTSTFLRLSSAVTLLLSLISVEHVAAQSTFPATPLASKQFAYPTGIPYKVDTDVGLIRGDQKGYNICNSTTQNQESLCQTSMFNSIDDFCLWGPPEMGKDVGSIEGEMVAWCTKPGHGTRLIPHDALQGIQWTRTPDYVQVVGFIDQTKINILRDDYGGEMDPHGADLRGNPMGGLVYSNAWSGNSKDQFKQAIEWHNFVGANAFCFKACDPSRPNAKHFCEHIFDRIGCAYNAPNNAKNGTFESCDGDNQDYPGEWVENGVTQTYQQPPESLGPIAAIPYTARVPASSNCVQYKSAELYSALLTVSASGETPAPTSTGATATGSGSGSGTATRTSAGASASNTSNAGSHLMVSGLSTLIGVALSALFLA